MCYSGKCLFEDNMGTCNVWNYDEFKQKYGYIACIVGGYPDNDNEEDKEYYKCHEEEFKRIYRDYMNMNLNF